ncbi:ERF family protein [Phenylobacterium kunshanense]|uniref:ERF family protein n=1 Tax=Phenylobacterium kunshanense TaxID=1445034 RepID=A0A328BQA5_9CAUL|nr:ERF family protein [Phenylobacterium kunshanense]RAK68779.1 hypothetical protein DJ019_01850 [Phenylobacterium kunshanense]
MSEPARQQVAPRQSAEVTSVTGASMMDLIARLAADPNTDVDKFERMLGMAERIRAHEAKVAFTKAKLAMKPSLPVIDERGQILNSAGRVQSTYAEWEDINEAIEPILTEHGFDLAFRPGTSSEGKVIVTGVLTHVAGHAEEAEITLPLDSSGGKNAVQGVGSSLSYGKRYAAIALLNITSRHKRDRDDDGRGAGMSQEAQDAIANINMAASLDDLRKWRGDHFDRLSKSLRQEELREVVALWNRRLKAAKGEGQANG